MAEILNDISRTFNEYLLLPNLTDERCIPSNVSLKEPLTKFKKGEEADLYLNIPQNLYLLPKNPYKFLKLLNISYQTHILCS